MMKSKKILATLLVLVLMMSCLAGCGEGSGKTKLKDGQTEIVVAYWNNGNGEEWIQETIKAFEAKYPEYKVTLNASASTSAVIAALGLEDVDTTDLYLTGFQQMDTEYTMPLEDVLAATADGDSKSLKEKLDATVLTNITDIDGHNYYIPWGGGVVSLVYNLKLYKDAGITQLPRTTDELTAVCDTLYENDTVPLCHFQNGGYYSYISTFYQAQYDGLDYYNNTYLASKAADGTSPSKDVFLAKDGRYETLKVYEQIITPEYVLAGSNSKSHTEIQTEFVNGSAGMMFNGSWLRNELATSGGSDGIAMMKMPVISAITDRLETIKNDYLLRDVIAAIDEVTEGKKDVSEFVAGDAYSVNGNTVSAKDWDAVKEARNMVYENFSEHSAFIPTYTDNEKGAKKFLEYMCSDEGLQIYYNIAQAPKPFAYSNGEAVDTSKMDSFGASQFDMIASASCTISKITANCHEIFTVGGATPYAGKSYIVELCTNESKSRKTADQLWEDITKAISTAYDNTWLMNIK